MMNINLLNNEFETNTQIDEPSFDVKKIVDTITEKKPIVENSRTLKNFTKNNKQLKYLMKYQDLSKISSISLPNINYENIKFQLDYLIKVNKKFIDKKHEDDPTKNWTIPGSWFVEIIDE